MIKSEFTAELSARLRGLPPKDLEKVLADFCAKIDERTEKGMTEEKAVSLLGPIEDLVEEITRKTSFFKLVAERIRPKRKLKTRETVLMWCTSPVWLPLQLAGLLLILAALVLFWVLILCVCALFVVGVCAGGVLIRISVGQIAIPRVSTAVFYIGAAIILFGVAILLFFAAVGAVRGGIRLCARLFRGLKRKMIKGREGRTK